MREERGTVGGHLRHLEVSPSALTVTQAAGGGTKQRRIYKGSRTPREDTWVPCSGLPFCSRLLHTSVSLPVPLRNPRGFFCLFCPSMAVGGGMSCSASTSVFVILQWPASLTR